MKDVFILTGLSAVAAIGMALFIFGPASAPSPVPENSGVLAASAVPFTAIAAGAHSVVSTPVNYIITSDLQLRELWAMTDAEGPVPNIDFSNNAVIAVFAGTEPSAGYAVAISSVADTPSARTVRITLTKPGGSCVLAQVATAPYEIVELSRTALPLAHEAAVQTASCLQ